MDKRLAIAAMLRTAVFSCVFSCAVLAAGPPVRASGTNIDAGGGYGDGNAAEGTQWIGGTNWEGVRVTVMDMATGRKAAPSMDFSNGADARRDDVMKSFGAVDKVDRLARAGLNEFMYSYQVWKPDAPLPRIIGGNASIAAVKEYFTLEGSLKFICSAVGFDYETLVSGGHMLMVEPVMYFHHNHILYAATATERALMGGDWMPTTTRERLPLSAFLEFDEPAFGLAAWAGPRSGVRNLDEMFRYLGVGMVRFDERPEDGPPPGGGTAVPDFEYRPDTEVYTWIDLANDNPHGFPHSPYGPGGAAGHGDGPLLVTFHTPSGDYTHELTIGAHGTGRAYARWRTPAAESGPAAMRVTVSHPAGIRYAEPTYAVAAWPESDPPDPEARDRHDGFRIPRPDPEYPAGAADSATWEENTVTGWLADPEIRVIGVLADHPSAHSFPDDPPGRQWDVYRGGMVSPGREATHHYHAVDPATGARADLGIFAPGDAPPGGIRGAAADAALPPTYVYYAYFDHGHWVHGRRTVTVRASATARIAAAGHVPGASAAGGRAMKSGYGLEIDARGLTPAPAHCTNFQAVRATFPEFGFGRGGHWRWLDRGFTSNGALNRFMFAANPWSTVLARTHHTPVWYPDGDYPVTADFMDAWTPGGELRLSVTDAVAIRGSLFDDWHVAPAP